MARVLDEAEIEHEVVTGVLVGDPVSFDAAEYARPAGDAAEEHGDERVPTNRDDMGYVRDAVPQSAVGETGVAHVWIEVDRDDRWIVEPYAEMRGTHEYESVATSVRPLDCLYVDDHEFDRAALEALVEEGPDTGLLRRALFDPTDNHKY